MWRVLGARPRGADKCSRQCCAWHVVPTVVPGGWVCVRVGAMGSCAGGAGVLWPRRELWMAELFNGGDCAQVFNVRRCSTVWSGVGTASMMLLE